MTIDIFNLDNLSDIPQQIRKDLKILSRDPFEKNIIMLFEKAGRELSIDEVTVAYYRAYQELKDRNKIMAKLYNMSRSKSPAIKAIEHKKGIYEFILVEKEEPM